MKHVTHLDVLLAGQKVGMLVRSPHAGISFAYDETWLQQGFDLAPGSDLSFQAGFQITRDRTFEGLVGVFNDSIPDGWARLLIDRAIAHRTGWGVRDILPLDRLSYIGAHGMGALEYRPASADEQEQPLDWNELADLRIEAEAFIHNEPDAATDRMIARLREFGGSPGGARPKAEIALSEDQQHCRSSRLPLPSGYAHWLVKFRGRGDGNDKGAVEYVYSLMAKEAGLEMPDTSLITIPRSLDRFFSIKRFDRDRESKLHMLSLAAYINADFRVPSIDYSHVLGATWRITEDRRELEKAYRLMVFNVMAHNHDDHAKNFTFLRRDRWLLSPAYDLTFSQFIGHRGQSEHATTINGKGLPARRDLLIVAKDYDLEKPERILEEVGHAVCQWPSMAAAHGVAPKTNKDIERTLVEIRNRML